MTVATAYHRTAAHSKMAKTLLMLADTAVQLAQEASDTAQRMASKASGADWALREDSMHLAGEQATIAESYAEIAEETGEADFAQLAEATFNAVMAAADAQAIAGVELTALPLMGVFDNPLFKGLGLESPEFSVILPEGAARKSSGQSQAKPKPKPVQQQAKPKVQPAAAKKDIVRAESGSSRGFWLMLAAVIVALFLI